MPLSSFLNGRPFQQLRGLQWLTLSDTGISQTLSVTSDTGGGATQVWTNAGTTPCRIDPVADRGSSRLVGGRIDERSTHAVTVPSGFVVSTAQRFAITGRGTFEVTATRDRTDAWASSFEVVQIS